MGYEKPFVIVSYTVDELRADAAACVAYLTNLSDRSLKTDIEQVEQPLRRLKGIG